MQTVSSLTFLSTPATVAVSLAVVVAMAVLCFVAWRRSGYHRGLGALELLRWSIVALAAVLLNQPEWLTEVRPTGKPTVAVLYDVSQSMDTRDVLPAVEPGVAPVSRREAIAELITPSAWRELADRLNVVAAPLASPQPGRGTDLFHPLAHAPEQYRDLVGVVLISDGDWNEGPPPEEAALQLRQKNIPVFTMAVGSAHRLPDVELLSLDVPTLGVTGKSVRIPFTIESTLPRDIATTVRLTTSDGDEQRKDIRIAALGRTHEWISWQPRGSGEFTVTLAIPPQADEALADNNSGSAPITIRQEQLKVLVVESYPRWEYRYLRNALARDPGVDVSCVLFQPGLSRMGGGGRDYLSAFPASPEELAPYDVVFVGDVGVEDGQLTAAQCRLLKGLVEHQAGGLVLMPGRQGRHASLLTTELSDLYPVVLDPAQPDGWGSRTPGHIELTESGRRSVLTKLADTEEENSAVWEKLPGFHWHAAVLRAKTGSDVLAVHRDAVNRHGRLPLLVTRPYGAGKVLFMGTDSAWRWREGVEDKYHYRFWGQVVRWMAYQRNIAKGETMRLFFTPEQPRTRHTLELQAHVMNYSGEPLSNGEVTAQIVAPSGQSQTLRLAFAGSEWGVYHGRFTATEAGRHAVTLSCRETKASLETSFFVHSAPLERVGRPARPEVLAEIARVTNGSALDHTRRGDIMDRLKQLPEPAPTLQRMAIYSHPATAALLIGLMGAFWVGRKWLGLL